MLPIAVSKGVEGGHCTSPVNLLQCQTCKSGTSCVKLHAYLRKLLEVIARQQHKTRKC